jgi:hypothetical protein
VNVKIEAISQLCSRMLVRRREQGSMDDFLPRLGAVPIPIGMLASRSLMDGEHCLRGFTNGDIRAQLQSRLRLRACGQDRKKQSAKLSRTFHRFHTHALIAKIPRTRRWRVTAYGRHVMGTSLYLREHHFPNAYAKIAA